MWKQERAPITTQLPIGGSWPVSSSNDSQETGVIYTLLVEVTDQATLYHTEGAIYSGSVHLHMTLLSVLAIAGELFQ